MLKSSQFFLVILAHSKMNDSLFLSGLANRVGCVGVPVFYFISGYFFNINKYGAKIFFQKKITGILIPWFFLGTLLFLLSKQNLNIINWVNWILGNGSYLYYLSMLFVCYVVYGFTQNKYFIYFVIFLNIVSLVITSFNIYNIQNEINSYLNPLNWLGFFGLGILLKNYLEVLLHFLNKNLFLICLTYIAFAIVSVFLENEHGYFSKFALVNELIGLLVVLALSTIYFLKSKIIIDVARFTFSIYLIHFLMFPLRKLLIVNHYTQFLNPILYLICCYLLIKVGLYFSKLIRLDKQYTTIMGLR